jgi:hypothetical protein
VSSNAGLDVTYAMGVDTCKGSGSETKGCLWENLGRDPRSSTQTSSRLTNSPSLAIDSPDIFGIPSTITGLFDGRTLSSGEQEEKKTLAGLSSPKPTRHRTSRSPC